jgi:aspartyl-tRNA synthetase
MNPYLSLIEAVDKVGETVSIRGWVKGRRNLGKIVFLDLRDRTGSVQTVGVGAELDEASVNTLAGIRVGFLISMDGVVQKRNSKNETSTDPLKKIEILIKKIEVISESEPLPYEEVDAADADVQLDEAHRLKYRYLDLRSERMSKNLQKRHEMNLFLRNYFSKKGFWEIETPCLTKGTPEGSREYIVPSRLHKGEFYVLPQSPQQYKQLLMVGGVEKYFQIARCFRDEDNRGDRQPEFTQFDLEMSFPDQETIMQLIETAMIDLVHEVFPHLTIQETPFPRLTYAEAMEKYHSDKPDLRKTNDPNLLAFGWVVDFPLFEKSESEGKLVSAHHPFTMPKKEDMALLETEPEKVRSDAYDIILNGFEVGGGSLRIFERKLQEKIFEVLGIEKEEMQKRFGHMLEAFTFAPPPHGGLALGLDRLIAVFQNEKTIREVIAFPKTGDAKDLLMGAPSELSEEALREAHIKIN